MDLTTAQKRTVLAAYLGWTLDAFDFFLLTFVIRDIAKEFGVGVPDVAYALFLTLAMRFIGLHLRPHRRQVGPQAGADARHCLLFGDRRRRRFLAQSHRVPRLAGAVRHCDGRRMGAWLIVGDGVDPAASARPGFRHPAMRLSERLPARFGRLWLALRPHFRRLHLRLAIAVPAERSARLRHVVHPRRGAGIAGLRAGAESRAARRPVGDDQRTGAWCSIRCC